MSHDVHWSKDVVTPPAVEPVTLAEAKIHLRVDVADDDLLIGTVIGAAREMVESFLRRTLITTIVDLFLDSFPGAAGVIYVPSPPLQSVTSIKFFDTSGVQQTLPVADYLVDTATEPGRITPSPDALTWENTELRTNAVVVRYVAGYGAEETDVPDAIRASILLIIADLYEHRESQSEVKLIDNKTAKNLLWTHKVPTIA